MSILERIQQPSFYSPYLYTNAVAVYYDGDDKTAQYIEMGDMYCEFRSGPNLRVLARAVLAATELQRAWVEFHSGDYGGLHVGGKLQK